jgi:predicted MFS family arabinose efflux permease
MGTVKGTGSDPGRTPEQIQAEPIIPVPDDTGAPAGWLFRTFSSLRNRNYRIFFIGQGVSLVGTWMRMTAQGWLVYELTGSKLLLGTVTGLSLLPLFLFSTIAGAVADRMSKRKLLLGAHSAMMVVSFALAFLVYSDRIEVWHLMVAVTLIGTAFAIDLPTRQSFYIQLVGRKDLLNAIALNSASFNAARIVGPATAGVIMAAFGIAACFLADSLSFLAVIGSLLMIRLKEPAIKPTKKSHLQLLMEGFQYVRGSRRIRILMLLLGVMGVFAWSYVALMPAFAQDILELSEAGYGALLAANGIGALAGALYVAGQRDTRRRRLYVFGGLWLFCVATILFALMRNAIAAGFFLAVSGGGLLVFLSTANTLIQLDSPDELRGRIMGVWALVFGGSLPIGAFVMGAVAERIGVVPTIAGGTFVCLLFSIVLYLRLPPRPQEPSEESSGAA